MTPQNLATLAGAAADKIEQQAQVISALQAELVKRDERIAELEAEKKPGRSRAK